MKLFFLMVRLIPKKNKNRNHFLFKQPSIKKKKKKKKKKNVLHIVQVDYRGSEVESLILTC